MSFELWLRPWAWFAPHRRLAITPGTVAVPPGQDAPLLLFAGDLVQPGVTDLDKSAHPVAHLGLLPGGSSTDREVGGTISLLPFPVRRELGARFHLPSGLASIAWPDAPERFRGSAEPQTDTEKAAKALMLRAEAVWDRISDVDELLIDSSRLWPALRDRWMGRDADEPRMDVIVKQARELSRVVDSLESRPRRILRRVHRHVPVARLQEVDRRSMLWLARQPGETLAERAGDNQRVLAVAREENFDTLENRVLRAYGELATRHGRDYLARNRTRRQSRRAVTVERFAQRCHWLARELADRGVRVAEPGVTPNFVLQQNPLYHDIWRGWLELLKVEQARDELWRWQARSWEEFSSLAILVALSAVPGAIPVANSPIWFRDEHHRGQWIEADAPLGVVYLPDPAVIVEVKRADDGSAMAAFGAPIWLRIGRLGEGTGSSLQVPVWPIWSPVPGLSPGETTEVSEVVARGQAHMVCGGIVVRPAAGPEDAKFEGAGGVLTVTLGTEGPALRETLDAIVLHLMRLVDEARG